MDEQPKTMECLCPVCGVALLFFGEDWFLCDMCGSYWDRGDDDESEQ